MNFKITIIIILLLKNIISWARLVELNLSTECVCVFAHRLKVLGKMKKIQRMYSQNTTLFYTLYTAHEFHLSNLTSNFIVFARNLCALKYKI